MVKHTDHHQCDQASLNATGDSCLLALSAIHQHLKEGLRTTAGLVVKPARPVKCTTLYRGAEAVHPYWRWKHTGRAAQRPARDLSLDKATITTMKAIGKVRRRSCPRRACRRT
jgi:hypothetical protein